MNQPDTRDRLLAASRKLFAHNGFDGTSVREITAAAGANLGAVTYHFGSKRALYEAVLESLMASLTANLEAAAGEDGPARTRLKRVVGGLFDFFGEHPEAPQFILREMALGGTPPPVALPYLRRNLQAVSGVIRAGQARGELRAVDPILATFTIISQCVWFALMRRGLARVTGVPLDRPDHVRAVEQHIAEVVQRAFAMEQEPA